MYWEEFRDNILFPLVLVAFGFGVGYYNYEMYGGIIGGILIIPVVFFIVAVCNFFSKDEDQ